jgi:hypothetical protein
LSTQVLLPVQASVDPEPTVAVQLEPPPHVTVLFVPVATVQVLVPVHDVLQFDEQLPSHVDFPEQVAVQPVPQVRSHCPCWSQW